MNQKTYNAAAVKFNLWMPETNKVCKLRQDGMTIRQIRQKNNEYDIFDAPSEEYSRTIMSVIAKRLDAGGGSFVPLFLRSDERGQKQLCLITCLLTDPLFYDFTTELIGAKLRCGLYEFDDKDVSQFWKIERTKVEKVAQLNNNTIDVLTRAYKRYLSNAGITDNNRGVRAIYPLVISRDIANWIARKRIKEVLYALTGKEDGKSSTQPKN